jgi:hypothetical protein
LLSSFGCSVDGLVLLKLTDGQMRKELSILPVGHREALRDAIKMLVTEARPMVLEVQRGSGGWR